MNPVQLASLNDPILGPLIGAGDPALREQEIERLIVTVTQPLSERILARYTRGEGSISSHDADDIISTVNVRVVRKLRAIAESEEDAVRELADYVATLTYNAINDHLRRRYPERTRLKNRLRYALTRDPRLALWTSASGLAAGLAAWRDSNDVLSAAPVERRSATKRMLDREGITDALVEIFRVAGRPVTFDALTGLTAELWNIADVSLSAVETPDRGDAAPARLEQRDFLRALWREIRLLPPQQRKALLLNLRDSETVNPVSLIALTGTATFGEIASTMEMTPEELAAIWNDLPLDDLHIAEMLGISRQQVINLRKAARQRLGRRLFRTKGRP